MLTEEALQIGEERREVEGKGERETFTKLKTHISQTRENTSSL